MSAEEERKLDNTSLTNYLRTSPEIANSLLSHCLAIDASPSSSAIAEHLGLA